MQEIFEKIKQKIRQIGNIQFSSYTKLLIAVDDVIKIIDQVAEEYNDGWIPCSERLPEEYGDYLVTVIPKYGVLWQRIIIVHYSDLMGICMRPHFHNGEVGTESFECLDEYVLAWRPLPVPYQPKGE